MHGGTRVTHRVSGQRGTLVSHGIWYAAVLFDGDTYPSTVAVDSMKRTPGGQKESGPESTSRS